MSFGKNFMGFGTLIAGTIITILLVILGMAIIHDRIISQAEKDKKNIHNKPLPPFVPAQTKKTHSNYGTGQIFPASVQKSIEEILTAARKQKSPPAKPEKPRKRRSIYDDWEGG